MKKCLSILLLLAIFAVLAGCGEKEPSFTTTLMVYMVGSDLESKSGAGTSDLQEMAESGVDLSRVNLLVYAGGTPTWHNDLANPEQHTLLHLTEEGFAPVTSTGAYSMGNGECLTNFLKYGYANFPADRYALVLWDHGNGPVIGYGKDMLFDNDCLTLQEMSQALAASPFGEENKLDWVGFDACLMASAELACVWAPYADYLVASQEVEPAFGWNYSFLSKVGTCQTPQLLQQVAGQYVDACTAYFAERGYKDRDVTLSCLDLSKAAALESAINGLFIKAAGDVQTQYNQLTARRVNTRALARATTGSEYDLVDLKDMAMWLGELYPEEATALIKAVEEAVVVNATNAQSLCGISLYYPFYNKNYYETDWAAAYAQLGTCSGYQQYLKNYETLWLGSDKLDAASSEQPQAQDGVYTLQLTAEQNENLASARYYILIRDGEEYFTRIFSSSQVENRDGLLTAGFDGNVLYVTDNYGNYHIPVSVEQDRVGDTGRYTVPVALTNCSLDISRPEGFEMKSKSHRYSLNIHKDTGEVTVSGLIPYGEEEDSLEGGKKEEAELSQWTNAYFLHDSHRYLSRYENGAILPVEQWPADKVITGRSYALEDGVHFEYAPLVAGEYYLLFEMEDTQGNRYCSELLPIHTTGSLPEAKQPQEAVRLDWTDGEEILLTQTAGVKLWLQKVVSFGAEGYVLRAENQNDYPVIIDGGAVFGENGLMCRDNFGFLKVEAGQTAASDYGMDLGVLSDLGLTRQHSTLSFTVTIYHGITYGVKAFELPFTVTLSEKTMLAPDETDMLYNSFAQPQYGCLALQQTLIENDGLRVQLLGLGGNGQDGTIRGVLLVENLTEAPIQMTAEGLCLDDLYVPMYIPKATVPGKSAAYLQFSADAYSLQPAKLTGVGKIRLLLRQYEYSPLFSGNSLSVTSWHDVTLTQTGAASVLPEGKVLYEKDGLRISLLSSQCQYGYNSVWQLMVQNTTGQDIALGLLEPLAGGVDCGKYVYITDNRIPANTSAICTLKHSNYDTQVLAPGLSFRLQLLDFKEEAILFELEQMIQLPRVPEQKS